MSPGFADRHVVDVGALNIDIFLEVQNKKYSEIWYLIDYIAYGFHLCNTIKVSIEICRKPSSLHPGLATSLPHYHEHDRRELFYIFGVAWARFVSLRLPLGCTWAPLGCGLLWDPLAPPGDGLGLLWGALGLFWKP